MNTATVLPFIGPIVVAVVAAYAAYKRAIHTSDKNAATEREKIRVEEERVRLERQKNDGVVQVEDRRATLAELESINRALHTEIERLRDDCLEDRQRFETERLAVRSEMADLHAEVRFLRRDRADQIRRDRARAGFEEDIVEWINDWLPKARALGLDVPDPPAAPRLAPLIDPDYIDVVRLPFDPNHPTRRWEDHNQPHEGRRHTAPEEDPS